MELVADKAVAWSQPDAPEGLTPGKVYIGPDPHGLGGFQVGVASSSSSPSRAALRGLFAARKGKTAIQLVVAVVHRESVHLMGPDADGATVVLPIEQAKRQLDSVLAEPDVLAATKRFAGLRKSSTSTGVPGFTNSGLFATHHLVSNVPSRPDWSGLCDRAEPLLPLRSKRLVEALGFRTSPGPNGTLLLSIGDHPPRAVAVLLDDSEHFDARASRFQLSPVAFGLALAAQQGLSWLVMLRKDQIRLYPGRDGVGVGAKGQTETYFEIDLATIDREHAGLLPLVFSSDALADDGTADELLRDSARYATALGGRLRERIYDEVVPPLSEEVALRLAESADLELDAEGLATAYRVTLHILFRLLFQAYAEDRGLLPSGRNEGFDANSLKTNAKRLVDVDPDEFGDACTIWFDLVQVWNAVDQGNAAWQIPAYNGGLFSTDPARSEEGALIKRIELPDRVLGPALRSLLVDDGDEGTPGPVDFRSLSVREFGTIYEGLLESALSVAEQDLTVDANGAWVPATKRDEVWAPEGSVYFHSASGERKATGSYFTPKIIVDHLIERSIVPVLSAHLERIAAHLDAGDARAAGREFFDFRVADLAMGSGHFLVAAVDKIEALMRDFLTTHDVPSVISEVAQLEIVAHAALGSDEVAKNEVDSVGLLRRQIARRCIYGLDINPMAVELARLALWIHTFVPGLPMSSLDHGLVCANSLTGIGTIDEALDALQPDRAPGAVTMFDDVILDNLASAKTLLIDVANASEANKAEVEESARALTAAREAADTARRIFNAAVAARLGWIEPGEIFDAESLERVIAQPEVQETEDELKPAHMPFLFPEVFLRDNPGFDVLLGNPPWEKLHVEEHQWWGLRLPGLRSMPATQRASALAKFRKARPDLDAEYQHAIESVAEMAAAVSAGPYSGVGAAHLDLYQAFAWRNWQVQRAEGRSAIVLPRGAFSGASLAEWRRTVVRAGAFDHVVFILNTGSWAFANVDNRKTIGLAVVARSAGRGVRFSGPFATEAAFVAGADRLAEVSAEEFESWSETAAFPLLPDRQSGEVFRRMKQSPGFFDARSGWAFRAVQGDLNATADRGVMELSDAPRSARVPVVTGASYNIWDPDAGTPFAFCRPTVLRALLASRLKAAVRSKRSPYFGMSLPRGQLPMDAPRVAFRDMTNQTNSRTTIACLLAPGTAAVHLSPLLVRRAGGVDAEAFVLGVMCSIPFDWASRRWVDRHLTFELLKSLPLPAYEVGSEIGCRVVEIAGRLAAVDERYADWAAEVGVPVGSVTTEDEKNDLIAELDALVSLLYGLSEDQVEHVFATFHRGWDYTARLAAVLAHYRAWKDAA